MSSLTSVFSMVFVNVLTSTIMPHRVVWRRNRIKVGDMGRTQAGKGRRFAFRRPKPALITDATRSPLEDWEHRKRVYAWIQFSRVPFLLAAGATYMWLHNWILATILFVISVPLPGIAVVIANGRGEAKDERTKQVYKPQVARAQRQRQAIELEQPQRLQLEAGDQDDSPKPPPIIIDHD